MFPTINTPWGGINLYSTAQIAGAVISVLIQMILLHRWFGDFRSVLFSALYGLYSWIGGYMSSLVRILSYADGELEGSLLKNILGDNGKHYIGTVIVIAVLFVPCTMLVHKLLYKKNREWKNDIWMVANSLAVGILIQHIFGRIGCFSRGCCYGIPYNGVFSMVFPYARVSYPVFPSQLFEIIGAAVLLIAAAFFIHRGKEAFGGILCGFSALIFLSEFWIDKRGTQLYYNLTVIQIFAVLLFLLGIGYLAGLMWLRKKDRS